MIDNFIEAITRNIFLGDSVLDAYMLNNGEKRLGIENVGIALGYQTKFFFSLKQKKAIWSILKNSQYIWVKVICNNNNDIPIVKTISVRDFVKIVTYESTIKVNKKAITLLAAFAETGIEKIIDDVFAGHSTNFEKEKILEKLLEKIVDWKKFTYDQLETCLRENREDVEDLNFYHDEIENRLMSS